MRQSEAQEYESKRFKSKSGIFLTRFLNDLHSNDNNSIYFDILDYFPAIPASHSSINVLNHIHQQWFGLCRLFLSGYPGHIHWKIVVVQVEAIPTFYA